MFGTKTLPQRFSAKCAKPNEQKCIVWTGTKTRGGYGQIRLGGSGSSRTTAHRVAWMLKHGEIPSNVYVLHKCDNPSCVNVDHLFAGSAAENTHDMMAKGRHGWKAGTPWQKLGSVDAERISDLRRAGGTQQEIADWIGVSRPLISMVLSGKLSYSRPAFAA